MSGPDDLPGARFDHVAHAAPSIRSLLPIYRDLLGGRFLDGGVNPAFGYRAVQLRYAGGTKIELLEPVPGSSFLDRFFERNPSGGLHHVTFTVPDVRAAVADARALGFDVIGETYDNPYQDEAFLHPRQAHGTLVQFIRSRHTQSPRGRTIEDVLAEAA